MENDPKSKSVGRKLSDELKVQNQGVSDEYIQDDLFNYEGYQVVRREFFAHLREPSITFNNCRVSVNMACLKRLPEVEYIQILINPTEKKLLIRPSNEKEKDSLLWCTTNSVKRKPKQVLCRTFFLKVIDMMNWNPDYRYKILGKLIHSRNEVVFVFDLSATEVYQRVSKAKMATQNVRTPFFPAEWQNQFGIPVEEHQKQLQISTFENYTVFRLSDKKQTVPANSSERMDEDVKS